MQALVWTIVVLWLELNQQGRQRICAVPRVAAQSAFEREYKPLRNAIALWAMAINRHVNAIGFLGQVGQGFGAEMGTLVADQKLQFVWQDGT
jgi:hypothetical protein